MKEVVGRGRCYDDEPGRVYVPRNDSGVNIHLHTTDGAGIHGVELPEGTEQIDRRRDDRHRLERHRDRHHDEESEEEEEMRHEGEHEEEYDSDSGYHVRIERDGSLTVRHHSDDRPRLRFRRKDRQRDDDGDRPRDDDQRRDRHKARDAAAIGAGKASGRICDHPDIKAAYENVDVQAREEMQRLLQRRTS